MRKGIWKSILSGVLAASLVVPGISLYAAEPDETLVIEAVTDDEAAPVSDEMTADDGSLYLDAMQETEGLAGEEDFSDDFFEEEEEEEPAEPEETNDEEEWVGDSEFAVETGEEILFEENEGIDDDYAGTGEEKVALTLGKAETFSYPAAYFELRYSFIPEESALYDFDASFSDGEYEIDYLLSSDLFSWSSGRNTEYNTNEETHMVNMFFEEALVAGVEYTIILECSPVTAKAGTGSAIIRKSANVSKREMQLDSPSGMARETYYTFTAPESGIYEIAIDSKPVDESVDEYNGGRVNVLTKNYYVSEEFEVDEQKSTEKFFMNKGETAVIDLYYNGADTILKGTLTPKKANGYFVSWDPGKGMIGTYTYDTETGEGEYTYNSGILIDSGRIYEPGECLDHYIDKYEVRYDGYYFKGWQINDTSKYLQDKYLEDEGCWEYQKFRIDENVIFHAQWAKLVPVTFNANGKTFDLTDYSEYQSYASSDHKLVTMKGLAGEALGGYVDLPDTEEYFSYGWYPDCIDENCWFSHWSTDAAGKNRLTYDYDKEIYTDASGNPVTVGANGITLYANWTGDGSGGSEPEDVDWGSFVVTFNTKETPEPGKSFTLPLTIHNTLSEAVTVNLYTHFYRSVDAVGESFGTLSGNGYNPEEGTLSLAAGGDASLTLTGVIPDTWGEKSFILIVVSDYAHGHMGQGGYPKDPSSSGIVFDKWDQEVKGQFGVPMTLSTRAYYDGADPLVYLWTEDGTPLPAQSTADGVSTCTYTPKRRSHYIEVKATAYDDNDNEITSGQCYIYVYCEDNAKVTNPTNTIKIAKNGSKTLNVTASGTTGKLSYVWYWYDKTKTVTDNDGYTHYDEHSIPDAVTTSASYTVKNYSDTNIVYGCEVIDERGYVEFAFELCTSHTGSWVVTKQPTTAAEGQETRTCTTCGYVETRSVAKLPAPAAPVKQPVSASIKASKTSVKLGKKATIKITSNSGAKLTVKAKSKNAKNKKYVKLTSGKTAKLAFTKKAPKGTYKFTVTSPANGNYKKTTKTISIKIK